MKAGQCQQPSGTFGATFLSFEDDVVCQHVRLIIVIGSRIRYASQDVFDLAGQQKMRIGNGTLPARFENDVPKGIQFRKMLCNSRGNLRICRNRTEPMIVRIKSLGNRSQYEFVCHWKFPELQVSVRNKRTATQQSPALCRYPTISVILTRV
jgi:hypothetical protein